MSRNNDEAKLDIAYHNFMRYAYPQVTTWHVKNEAATNAIQGSYLKARGVRAGVHDHHLIWSPQKFATLELKRPEKKAAYSPKQAEFGIDMDAAGFPHACCNSGATIVAALAAFGLPPTPYKFPPLASSETSMRMQYISLIQREFDLPTPRGMVDPGNPFAAQLAALNQD